MGDWRSGDIKHEFAKVLFMEHNAVAGWVAIVGLHDKLATDCNLCGQANDLDADLVKD
jgi:hypothetical protein